MTADVQAVAYHEAGHAVANVRFQFQCDEASITPGKHWLGYARSVEGGEEYDPNTKMFDKARAKNSVVSFLAGYAAEIEYKPASKSHAKIGAATDFARAADILGKLGPGPVFNSCLAKAREFVKKNWKAIEIVARELLEVKTLDGESIERIVEIADGKEDAVYDLANWRQLKGLPPSRQFPYKVGK
jgi:ATP-dependent Zn protease